jgi:Glycosyl hydrolase family 26
MTSPLRSRSAAQAVLAIAASLAVSLPLAGTASAKPAAPLQASHPAAAKPAKTRSGLPWRSGAWLPTNTAKSYSRFATWRHRAIDVGTDYLAGDNWAQIDDAYWVYKVWKGRAYPLALGVPMLPSQVKGVSLVACAAGKYNSHWTEFGRVIKSYGLGSSIIRLGWEFNGDWYPWKAARPAAWAECWRQIVTSARKTAPNLKWDWNPNRGVATGPGALSDPTKAYPGNAYVNEIGLDTYDQYPPVKANGGWNFQVNGPQGMNYWLNFAIKHGKKLAVPEWGSYAVGTESGGDDPAYVKDMYSWFAAHSGHISFEANFQSTQKPYGSYWVNTRIPKAAAEYRKLF